MRGRKFVTKTTGLVLLLAGLTACSDQRYHEEQHSYFYDLSEEENGTTCNTRQTFPTKEEYCNALNDEELNNSCAVRRRAETFTIAGCPGTFNTDPDASYDLNHTFGTQPIVDAESATLSEGKVDE